MRRGQLALTAAFLFALGFASAAAAQREAYSFVSYADSDVSLLSPASDEETARVNTPVLSGDRIASGPGSRAEVVLASGNVVRIDGRTDLRFDRMSRTYESDDDRDLLFLERGAVAVEIRDAQPFDRALRLDTEDATIVVEGRGEIRVDAGRRGTEVWVLSGTAEVSGRAGGAVVQAGQYALVRGSDAIEVESYDPPGDRFARFVDERRDRRPRGGATTYVSADYQYESAMADFDSNGSWLYVPTYSRWCWRPTVAADWRPYSLGYWRWTPGGLTWVSYEPWGWLPYHYGSWCWEDAYGWYWMPGSVYAPAWVYWSYTPSYVGWCPTGYYGYYPSYYRSARLFRGADGGIVRVPHLRGRVDLVRVDPRGWNYTSTGRIGGRLDPARDVVRGDRLPVRPGDTAIISTSPLRIDRRGAPAPSAVRDAVRRIADPAVPRDNVPVSDTLTSILRRDPNLSPAAAAELRRAAGRERRVEPLRPVTPDAVAGGARSDGAASTSFRTTSPPRAGEPAARRDDGWRSPVSTAPRDVSPRAVSRTAPGDTGWQAPRPAERGSTFEPRTERRFEPDWRDTPRREASPPRADTAPQAWQAPAPRREAPARPGTPARSYDAPRAAPAPNYAPPPAPRYAPPPAAPAPAPAPRVAPAAPRGDPPKGR